MAEIITTLPITPKENPHIGLITTPLIGAVLAKRLRLDFILSLNTNGVKGSDEYKRDSTDKFIHSLQSLGIYPQDIWMDSDPKNKSVFEDIISKFITSGIIHSSNEEVSKCECRKNEYLTIAENRSEKRSASRENQNYCDYCRSVVVASKEDVLLTSFQSIAEYKLIPDLLSKELNYQQKLVLGRNHLISRSRTSAVYLKDLEFGLDGDMLWQNYLNMLALQGEKVRYVVGSGHSLNQIAMIASYTHAYPSPVPDFILPPYFKFSQNLDSRTDTLIDAYGASAVKINIMSSISWRRREAIVDLSKLEFLRKIISHVPDTLESEEADNLNIKDTFSEFNYFRIQQIMRNLRRGIINGIADSTILSSLL